MKDKGFPKGSNIQAPPFLALYEESRAKKESLYLDSSQFIDIVYYYHATKQNNKALQAIEDGLKFHPTHTRLLLEKTYILIEMGFVEDAIESIELIDNEEDLTETTLIKAELSLLQNNLKEAAELLSKIEIENTEDLTLILDVVFLYLDFNLYELALIHLKSVEHKFKNNVSFVGAYADCVFGLEEYEKAIVLYDKLLDMEPYNGRHWFGLARCYFELERYTKCLEACDYGLITDSNQGDFYLLKANSYFQLDLTDKAISLYKKAIEHKADDIDIIYILLGACYEEKKEWDNSIESYRMAVKKVQEKDTDSPLLPDIYNNLAYVLAQTGEFEEALEFSQIAFFTNKNIEYLFTRVEIYILDNKMGIARVVLDTILNEINKDEDYYRVVKLLYGTKALVHPKQILRDMEAAGVLKRDYLIDLACLSLLLGHTKELERRNKQISFKVEVDSLDELYLYLLSKDKPELARLIKEYKLNIKTKP